MKDSVQIKGKCSKRSLDLAEPYSRPGPLEIAYGQASPEWCFSHQFRTIWGSFGGFQLQLILGVEIEEKLHA